jgi:hypothetical protein
VSVYIVCNSCTLMSPSCAIQEDLVTVAHVGVYRAGRHLKLPEDGVSAPKDVEVLKTYVNL